MQQGGKTAFLNCVFEVVSLSIRNWIGFCSGRCKVLCCTAENPLKSDWKQERQQIHQWHSQAKSVSFIITTEPQLVHCGPTKEVKERWEEVKWSQGKEEWKKIDFKNERLPRCLGGLWLQCCTLHLFTAQRMTHVRRGKRRRERCCLQNAVISNNIVTVP